MLNKKRLVGKQDNLLIRYQIECDGKVLEGDLNAAAQPYQMDAGLWPSQLERQMLGQALGSQLKIDIKADDDVFGKFDPERVMTMHQADFEPSPEVGELIEFSLPDGRQTEGQVLSVFDDNMEVDFNHPYVGRDLVVKIHIESIT